MIRIILIWLLQALLLAGLGRILQQWWWKQRTLGLPETFWLGMAGVICFTQFWHFFLPVNALCLGILCMAALPGVWLLWRERKGSLPESRELFFWGMIVAVFALLAASHVAVRSIQEGDTRLYHLNMVRWNNEYPVVPGLANLHQRFGVHSTWVLYGSLLDIGWADQRSAWLISGLPLMVLIGQWLGIFLFQRGPQHTTAKIYCLLTVPYLLEALEGLRPNLYYDKPPLLLLLALGLHLLQTPWLRREVDSGADWKPSAMWCLTAAALAFSFKASTALALIFVFGAVVFRWWQAGKRPFDLVRVMTLPTLLVGGWIGTNLILSGWPLFPLPVLGVPLPWSQPGPDVKAFHELIADWAPLQSSEGLLKVREGFWVWWPIWLQGFAKTAEHFVAILCLFAGAGLVWGHWFGAEKLRSRYPYAAWATALLYAMGAAGVGFWLITAPDLRFGDGLFYFWFGIAGALLMPLLWRNRLLSLLTGAGMCLLLLTWTRPVLVPWVPYHLTEVHRARPDGLEQKQLPGTPAIWVPTDTKTGMIGDAPLPAAPTLDPRLRMREPGRLGAGFYLEQTTPSL